MNKFAIVAADCSSSSFLIVFVIGLFFWALQPAGHARPEREQEMGGRADGLSAARGSHSESGKHGARRGHFEKSTIVEVTKRAGERSDGCSSIRVKRRQMPSSWKEFQAAQGQLSNALSRLLVVVERYP